MLSSYLRNLNSFNSHTRPAGIRVSGVLAYSSSCPPWDRYLRYPLSRHLHHQVSELSTPASMTRRFSTAEKGKWTAAPSVPSAPVRRAPIPIPATNNSVLIEQNKLSLIGRVTNPAAQNTHALVDFFLHHWHVSGSMINNVKSTPIWVHTCFSLPLSRKRTFRAFFSKLLTTLRDG